MMMAMTPTRAVGRRASWAPGTATETSDRSSQDFEAKTRRHSGFSALLQAATSQLEDLSGTVNLTRVRGPAASSSISNCHPQSYASLEERMGTKTPPATTPTLGPEAEARKLTFPEILMTLLEDKNNADIITFLPDGKFFALRTKEFSEVTMINYFKVASFTEFLDRLHSWGFYRVEKSQSCGIEIFRHPHFLKGDWGKCSQICFGESPTDARLSALPERARIEYTLSDESTLASSKRRLSPSHTQKPSANSTTPQKQRLSIPDLDMPSSLSKSGKADMTTDETAADTRETEDVRCLALAITTEKMNLKHEVEERENASTPLVERAVENATHTIVTDAIETLLRDVSHTRETYLKHEKELSRSSLPGVVPISKQLFSPPGKSGSKKGEIAKGMLKEQELNQQPIPNDLTPEKQPVAISTQEK